MCGIIGILSDQPAAPRLVEALKRLEYRGYDSAGVALLEAGKLKRLRAPGKLTNLDEKVRGLPLKAGVGIGHTRWATHGQPNETNAHPHASGRVAIVHNGIIENFRELREAMEARGRKFETETDSETIAHLIDEGLSKGLTPKDAFKATLDQLRGAFAIAAIITPSGDPYSMMALAGPMTVFYAISIVIGKIAQKRKLAREAAEA